ncbi:hypothetical protein ACMV8I_15455 [Ewingella sp. S1.OA.A_B6]
MPLSKRSIKEQDCQLSEKLKRRDNLTAILFLTIPLGLFLAGGRHLLKLTPFLWVIYSIGYVFLFRKSLKGFSTDELRLIARRGYGYAFYSFCWIFLIGVALSLVAYLVNFFNS